MNSQEIIESLNWRYAVKKFDPSKKIPADQWEVLEETLRLAPSASGLQPWKFIVVKSQDIRKKLTPASYNQVKVEEASHLLVITNLKEMNEDYIQNYLSHIAKVRGVSIETLKEFRNSMVKTLIHGPLQKDIKSWAARQAYIALGSFVTVAAMLHIDACPMEGFESDKYDEILNLKNTPYTSVAVITAGYRSPEDHFQNLKKVRFDKKDIIQVV